jgi:cell division protein FtsL
MNRKLITTIIILSIAMLELLAVRQGHINTVNSMTTLHRKIDSNNEKLNMLKIQIERACSPSEIKPILAQIIEVHEKE